MLKIFHRTKIASSLSVLKDEIISNFQLTPSSDLLMTYCGKQLLANSRLPRDGAIIYVSVKQAQILNNFKYSPDAPVPPPTAQVSTRKI